MIVFTKMNTPEHLKECRWRVEYYCDDPKEKMFPVGVAYLVVVNKTAQLNFIMVADQWRRRGIALEIFKACSLKWPYCFQYTSGMDKKGKALIRKFENLKELKS